MARFAFLLFITLTAVAHAQVISLDARPIPEQAAGSTSLTDYTLTSKWNERRIDVEVVYKNTSERALVVQGIQCSEGLFIVDYPKTVPANGSAKISVIVETRDNSDNEVDLIRLKTNQGEKLLRVKHDREKVVTLDQRSLTWQVGETVAAKTLTVRLTNGSKLSSAKALGGHTARVEEAGGGVWRVIVTPSSTVRSENFPVVLTYEPAIPGVASVITCSIVSK